MEFFSRLIRAVTELHPLHPMMVHFPIGLTGAACLFILLALWRRNKELEQAAFFNLVLAAVGAFAAGLAGLRDNIVRYDGGAANIQIKIVLGIVLFILTALAAIVRWKKPDILWKPSTRIFYVAAFVVSFALAILLGFLGGVILYGF